MGTWEDEQREWEWERRLEDLELERDRSDLEWEEKRKIRQAAIALEAVQQEPALLYEQWGFRRYKSDVWLLAALSEGVGELARSLIAFQDCLETEGRSEWHSLEGHQRHLAEMMNIRSSARSEALQVAAMAIAVVDHIGEATTNR